MEPVTYDTLVVRTYQHGGIDDKKGLILRNEILNLAVGIGEGSVNFIYSNHEEEVEQIKIGAFIENRIVGTLNLVPQEDGTLLLRQFAVTTKLQGMGIGRKLMDFAHGVAKEQGCMRIVLEARQNVCEFYAKCGYKRTGKQTVYPQVVLEEMYIDF